MSKERIEAIRKILLVNDTLNPVENDPGRLDHDDGRECWKSELDYVEPYVKAYVTQLLLQTEAMSNELFFNGASSVNASKADQHAHATAWGTELVLGWVLQNWAFIFARLEDC